MPQLKLTFGPSVPVTGDILQIAFVAGPYLRPDTAIASLSSERYVVPNYAHIEKFTLHSAEGSGFFSDIGAFFEGTTITGEGTGTVGAFTYGGALDLSQDIELPVVISPIRMMGVEITKAGSWQPLITPGTVWHNHIVHANEPASSWLIRSGLEEGDEVILIYSVPEHLYSLLEKNSSSTFPGSGTALREIVEFASVTSPHTITYEGDIKVLKRITLNGTVLFDGDFDHSQESTVIKRFDNKIKTIETFKALFPDDLIQITYLSYPSFASYSGYRDYTGNWFPFDANPEYGHWIKDPDDGNFYSSPASLLKEATIYLIPSAYVQVITVPNTGEASGTIIDSVALRFESAYNWGETHFIRHLIGRPQEELSPIQKKGTKNTWGHAVLGINRYDEGLSASVDIFSKKVPSMMPLGRIILSAPASVNSVATADTRIRGGGVPMDFPMQAVETQTDGIDKLRNFWDLGIWDGKVVKDGGVVEVEIQESVLNSFTQDEIEEFIRQRVSPGVDVVIKYVQ